MQSICLFWTGKWSSSREIPFSFCSRGRFIKWFKFYHFRQEIIIIIIFQSSTTAAGPRHNSTKVHYFTPDLLAISSIRQGNRYTHHIASPRDDLFISKYDYDLNQNHWRALRLALSPWNSTHGMPYWCYANILEHLSSRLQWTNTLECYE